ncbi:MAG: thiol reductant ABC exporter subunit CydC [Gaiellaceae bacterium]|jgi:thiol reductant ABC exporter CydC subunit
MSVRRILAEARPLRRRLALSILLGACAIGAGIGLMSTSGYLISKAALEPPILSLGVAIGLVQFFGISRAVFRYLERLVSHDAAFRFLRSLRVSFYERLEPLVPGGLGTARSGDLLSRFVADVEAMQFLFLRALGPPLVALVVCAGAVLAAALVLPLVAVVLFVGLFAGGLAAAAVTGRAARESGRREAPAQAQLASEVIEALVVAPELVAFGRFEWELERIDAVDRKLGTIGRRHGRIAGLGEALVLLASGATLVAVLLVAVPAVRDRSLGGVWLGMLALLALSAFEAVRALPIAAQQSSTLASSARRLFELADRPPPVREPERPRSLGEAGVLRLDGGRLRYDERGPWVLDGVSLELRPGRRVALVGPSGAGKTTIANVLVRFQELDGGRATLDGHDLGDYAQDDVRRLVALAGQDAHLFSTTIRENVRFARPGASDEEIAAALRRAGVWDWVSSLPEGLGTYVGETGDQVSGGQRRRIALARAFLSGARLLILDEPTAHLDRKTAEAILDDLLAGADDTGLLVITHDELMLDRFDEVLRLEGGRIL